jgi:hypothetical protein
VGQGFEGRKPGAGPVLDPPWGYFRRQGCGEPVNCSRFAKTVTATPDACERTAIDLASEPARPKAIERRLTDNRLSALLFNTALFTRHID